MVKAKKLLIVFLIVTILMPFLSQNVSIASNDSSSSSDYDEWSDEYEEGPGFELKGLTIAQRTYFAKYVRAYMQQNHENSYKLLQYDSSSYSTLYWQNEKPITELVRSGTAQPSGVQYSGKIPISCAYFTAAMLHQALNINFEKYIVGGYWGGCNDSDYATKAKITISADDDKLDKNLNGEKFFNRLTVSDVLQEGDVLFVKNPRGHALIYVGINPETGNHEFANTDGPPDAVGYNVVSSFNNRAITLQQLQTTSYFRNAVVCRVRPEIVNATWNGVPEKIVINWLNCTTEFDPDDISTAVIKYDDSAPLFYSGIANPVGSLGTTNRFTDIIKAIWNDFKDIINYAIGVPALIIRMPFVGLAHMAEDIISATAQVISEDEADREITLEKIIFNDVPLFDINIFDFEEAGGKPLTDNTKGENIITSLRKNIAGWYVAFRNLVIVVLFAILIYLGIRMAITSIAEEKAHYKRMMVDWFISFVIVMCIHFFLVIVLGLNDHIISILKQSIQDNGIGSVYEKVKELAYGSIKFTEGWYGTIMYIALIWYMVKFAWKYAKRMLTGYILIMLSPLVAISYALDKIKDNKAQSLGKWMKEIAYTVLIQAAHCLIYVTFVSGIIAQIIAGESNILQVIGVTVLLIIAIKFMETAENIFKTIFGFESSSVLKEVMSSSFEMFAKFKLATKVGKAYFKGLKTVGKTGIKFGKGVSNLASEASISTYMLTKLKPDVDWKNANKSRLRKDWDTFKEGFNKEKDDPQLNYSKETTTDINKFAKMWESKHMAGNNAYASKAKQLRGLGGATVKNAALALHFTLDEGTSITAAISKGIAASVAGAQFMRAVGATIGDGTRRVIRGPRASDGKKFSSRYGLRAYMQEQAEYNKRMHLFYNVNELDVELTQTMNEARENGVLTGLNEGATEEEKRITRTTLSVLSESLKTPSLKDTSEAVMTAEKQATSEDSINAIDSLEELYDLTNSVGLSKANSKNKTGLNKNGFIDKTKSEMQTLIIKNVMQAPSKGELSFSGEYADKFADRKETASKEAIAQGLVGDKAEKYVRDAVKEELQKALASGEGQKELMHELGTENMATIATKVARDDKGVNAGSIPKFTKTSVKKSIEQRKEEKQIDYMIDKSIDTLEQKTGLKINRDAVKTNFKKEIENVAVNNYTGEVETIKIQFGQDIDKQIEEGKRISNKAAYGRIPLSDKQLKQIGKKYNLSDEQIQELKDSSRPANEQFKDATRQTLHNYLNEGSEESKNSTFTENEREILQNMSLDDYANLLTRSLNGKDSIERKIYTREDLNNLFFRGVKTKETEKQIKQVEELIDQSVKLQRESTEAMLKLNLSTFSVVEDINKKNKSKR